MLKEVATSRDINDLGRSGQAKNIKKDDIWYAGVYSTCVILCTGSGNQGNHLNNAMLLHAKKTVAAFPCIIGKK